MKGAKGQKIHRQKLLLRARVVVPISRGPIGDGAVLIEGGSISEVGRWKELAGRSGTAVAVDMGDVALLPD